MQKITLITTLSVLALAACSPQAPEPAVSAPVAETPAAPAMADMPMAAEPQAAAGPITSMGFTTTDPAMLKDLKVGDMVVFDLVSAAEPPKISRIAKQ